MSNPYANRVNSLISLYRSNPHLFNDDQLDELQELANQSGVKFSPIREEFRLRNVIQQASSGFLEGLTTIPVGEAPRTTYESIAHSLGHLVGFAPGIMAGPLSWAAKGTAKLGAKGITRGLQAGAKVAGQNVSVPMLFGDWVKKGASKGLRKANLETLDYLSKGAKTRAIASEAVHLGAASAMSSIWKGPDVMMDSMIGGAVAGGMFGGLGQFTAIGNMLKQGNVKQVKRAEQRIKAGIGASMMGIPTYLRGEPIEMVMYETILGGYFGHKSRPAFEKEGGKFIADLMYYPKKDVIFTPNKHPDFKRYSKETREYITNRSTEQAEIYLKNQYPDIPEESFTEHFTAIARNDLGREPTKAEVQDIMRQEATQHYFGNWEYIENPFETPNRGQEPSFEQQSDYTDPVDKAPKTSKLDAQKARYKDKAVLVVEMDGSTYTVRGVSGEYRDTRHNDTRIDRPSDNFQNTEFREITAVYQNTGGRYWKSFKPLATKITKKGKLEYELGPRDWWRLDNNLDRQDHYIYGGVKDKGVLNARQYHIDTGQYTVEQLIQAMSGNNTKVRNELRQDYQNSLDVESKWYNKDISEIKGLHDRKWKSNVLSEAQEQGFYQVGSGNLNSMPKLMRPGGAKNVTDWNKRQQLFHDRGVPVPEGTFKGPLKTIILNDRFTQDDTYTVRTKDGKIETKINESNTDGTLLLSPRKFKDLMREMGLPLKHVSMNKPVIMLKHGDGILMVKSAGAIAEGPMVDFMKTNGLDMVIFSSAAKQTGGLNKFNYSYSEKDGYRSEFTPQDVLNIDPSSIRINTGTFENPSRMYGTHFVRQLFGNLNEVQNKGIMNEMFDKYYTSSYEGTEKARTAVEKFFETENPNLLKDIKIDDLPLRYIHRIWNAHYNTKAGEMLRKQIFRMEESGALEDIDRFTKEEYRDYLARNDRIINITDASESTTKLFKHTRKYSDKVYKKYMIKRLTSPKYKYSAKSWLAPVLPHNNIKEGEFKAYKDFNPDVIVDGKEMKLQKLWSLYEKNPKKYAEALEFVVIRVPSDSVSGSRTLKFGGYVGERGTGILTRQHDNTYLGGADKDSDTVFLYQGLDKKLKNSIKDNAKEWQRKDGTWLEGKSEKYDKLLRGDKDPRYETMGSKFSPAMRMQVARSALMGKSGLGFAMTAKNTMLGWIDILNRNGGQMKLGDITIRLKSDGSELRRLAREMINTAADSANFPNMSNFTKWRDYLFDTTFDATMNGKKVNFSTIVNKTDLGGTHKIQNLLDPKGKNYNRDGNLYTINEWQVGLRNTRLLSDSNTAYSNILRKAQQYNLDSPIGMESLQNYHKILLEANKFINSKDSKEADFIRKHLTKLYRVPIGRDLTMAIEKARKTGDWEAVTDMVSNDTFMVASNNALGMKGLEIYRAFRENGIEDPTGVMDGILKVIARKATALKNKHENVIDSEGNPRDTSFKEFDSEISAFKTELASIAAANKISLKPLSEYFDIWMISPYNYGSPKTRSGASRLSMQSQEISNNSWKEVMGQFEKVYQNINKKVEGEPIPKGESAIFRLPPDYNNPVGKPIQAKTITDLVVYNATKPSPLQKQETADKIWTRKALTKEQFKDIEQFESNMKKLNVEHPDIFLHGWTVDVLGYPKSYNELNIADVKALNRYFKDFDRRFSGDGLPSWVYWADPNYVDQAMWNKELTFYNAGYTVKSPKGENKVIYKGVGTLGTIRNWFRQTNRQMDVYTDAIHETNNDVYKFRMELTPNESLAVMKGIISKVENNPNLLAEVSKKYMNRKYIVNKKEYTFDQLVDKYSKAMKNDLDSFGNEWLFARNDKGEYIDFSQIDSKKNYTNLNKYLKWDKNSGQFDIMNFIRKSVSKGERGERVPKIPLENIYRFQYEYVLEKIISEQGLKGKAAKRYREMYRRKVPFKGIRRMEEGYFPHLGFGWNAGARKEMWSWIRGRSQEVYNAAIESGLSKKEAEQIRAAKQAELEMKYQSGELDAGGMDKHAIDQMLSKIDFKKLSPDEIANSLKNIGFNTRPESILSRSENMPGYDKRASVFDSYKEKIIRAHYRNLGSIMANYRIDKMVETNPFGEFSKKDFKRFNPDAKDPLFKNWTDVWADYVRFYVRDSFGHMSTFSQRIVDSMKHGDPLKLKNTMYMTFSDQKVIAGLEKINKQFKKFGVKVPFLGDVPKVTAKEGTPEYKKQVQTRKEYLSQKIHDFGRLEARYQLMTLLANTGTLTANMFGGSAMTISSAGLRNFVRVNNFNWLKKNVLFDKGGNPTLTYVNNKGKKVVVKTKEDLYKWIQDKGVIDNFINDELQTNLSLKKSLALKGKSGVEFIKELKKILKQNPDAKNETLNELAKRYGVYDEMLRFGGAFMQVSERKLRRDSFLSHALQAKDRLGIGGKNMSLNDPYLVDAGLRGVEATQFLYHSAFRPAFMRTSLGKVLTRFKLFAFQSIRTRKELARRADYYGFKKGTKDYERMKDLFIIDMITMALGSAFAYSLFDTALPPPYDYLQETSQWLFGDKREREKAFFGTYPRPIAPLQLVTPPSARVLINPIKSLINNDWERFMDYHIHTMYPFGRIVRQVEKTVDEPYGTTQGRFMQQFFRLPTDKLVSKYNRAQLQKERSEIIAQTLGE